jgi:hypothetical protein
MQMDNRHNAPGQCSRHVVLILQGLALFFKEKISLLLLPAGDWIKGPLKILYLGWTLDLQHTGGLTTINAWATQHIPH